MRRPFGTENGRSRRSIVRRRKRCKNRLVQASGVRRMVDSSKARAIPAASVACKPPYFWQRRRVWIWSFVLFVVLVVGFVVMLPTTRALVQFHRINAGMTEQEVGELLGPPTARFEYNVPGRAAWGMGDASRSWLIGEIHFSVWFKNDKVVGKLIHTDLPIAHRLFPKLFGRNLL